MTTMPWWNGIRQRVNNRCETRRKHEWREERAFVKSDAKQFLCVSLVGREGARREWSAFGSAAIRGLCPCAWAAHNETLKGSRPRRPFQMNFSAIWPPRMEVVAQYRSFSSVSILWRFAHVCQSLAVNESVAVDTKGLRYVQFCPRQISADDWSFGV